MKGTLSLPSERLRRPATVCERTRTMPSSTRFCAGWARLVPAFLMVCHVVEVPAGDDIAEPIVTRSRELAPLPTAVSSLGAVASDGMLYVYGGHVAPVHTYSTEAVTGAFGRLDLATAEAWESLPGGPALQGMNIASHRGRILRVGGMAPRNAPGAEVDNRSTASADCFDPATGRWAPIPDLPEPRSSHDVAVIGDMLYVVGGWNMRGEDGERWFDEMMVIDLSADVPRWRPAPQPFQRRALVVAVHRERLWVIGGFDDAEEISLRIDVFDPISESWRRGPLLPEPSRNGFAPAACVVGDRLIVSVADGSILELVEDRQTWRVVARVTPRIVHRMVPYGDDAVVLVGGASGRDNLATVESVGLKAAVAESATNSD